MSEVPIKRYRREKEESESEEDIDNYEPYVPVKERKKQKLLKLGRLGQVAAEAAAETKSSSENDPDDEGKVLSLTQCQNSILILAKVAYYTSSIDYVFFIPILIYNVFLTNFWPFIH